MTEARRPVHLAVLAGISASAYAISLAGITALQAATDADLAADRAPATRAANLMATGHEDIETTLDQATRAYSLAANRYSQLVPQLEGVEQQLEQLTKRASAITGAANALPGRVALPRIASSTRTVTRTTVVNATTGASGKP